MGVLVNGVWQTDDSKFKMDPSKPAEVFATAQQEVEVTHTIKFFIFYSL